MLRPRTPTAPANVDAAVVYAAPSRYIHCTKNRFVALCYAEEIEDYQQGRVIACVDLTKVMSCKDRTQEVLDVS